MHYIDGGRWSRASGPDTAFLLALARAAPSKARVHKGEWGDVVTPLKLREWERAIQTEILPGMSAMASGRDSGLATTMEALGA